MAAPSGAESNTPARSDVGDTTAPLGGGGADDGSSWPSEGGGDTASWRRWRRWPSGLLNRNRLIDGGLLAWALIGFLVVAWVGAWVVAQLSLVIIPLVIALFPAALLAPASEALKRRKVRPAAAAGLVLGLFLLAFIALFTTLGWLVSQELTGVADAVEEGYADIQEFFRGRFDVDLPPIGQLLEQLRGWALGEGSSTGDGAAVTGAAMTTLEWAASFLLGLVALFFYLKDGRRIASWFIRLFPPRLRDDAGEITTRVWSTLGAYFRGQLVVAAVDAIFIGLGLLLLDIPLAFPLAILIFIGGMFPVVGAFTAGALAVLIALADQGVLIALVVLGINIVVQQVEGNLLEPLIVGRATELHPLAVLVALTAGGVTFGILGAFLAVPVVASLNAGLRYLVRKDMARPPDGMVAGPRNVEPGAGPRPDADGFVPGQQLMDRDSAGGDGDGEPGNTNEAG